VFRILDRGMARFSGTRNVERSAISAFVPVVAMVPFSLLALAVLWLPFRLVIDVPYWTSVAVFVAVGLTLFIRPVQALVLTPILGARRPTEIEAETITELWRSIAQANDLPPDRYVLRVLPSEELNAFACGGHLVVVTTYAVEEMSEPQLRGVLAHELSHHLGLHTVAITIGHWLSAPVVLLARIGFFLENVAHAAGASFGRRSPVIATAGTVAATMISMVSWVFTAGIRASDSLANVVGHGSEFEADQRAVRMGFGRELASALRHVLASGAAARPIGWRARLAASHPPARTRVARIEALLRHPAR